MYICGVRRCLRHLVRIDRPTVHTGSPEGDQAATRPPEVGHKDTFHVALPKATACDPPPAP